jgi:hypothetical protein
MKNGQKELLLQLVDSEIANCHEKIKELTEVRKSLNGAAAAKMSLQASLRWAAKRVEKGEGTSEDKALLKLHGKQVERVDNAIKKTKTKKKPKRHKYAPAEKKQMVKEIERRHKKGEQITAVCEELGITNSSFYTWRKEL